MSDSDQVMGYKFDDTGVFDLSIYPSGDEDQPGIIIVGSAWSETVAWGPKTTEYWEKDAEEIRQEVITEYLKGLRGDFDTIAALYREAERIGIELGEGDE